MDEHITQRQDRAPSMPVRAAGGSDFRRLLSDTFRDSYQPLIVSLRRRAPAMNVEDCEDAAQQAFLELWRKPRLAHGESSITSYLFRAARSRLLNRMRSDAARRRRDVARAKSETDTAVADPLAKTCAQERDARVRQAVLQLPPQQRQAIEAIDLQERSAVEAVKTLGTTLETLRGRRRRAKSLLARILREYE